MMNHKALLKHFSDRPITIDDLQTIGFDGGSKDFINTFLWLKSEQLIKPLDGDNFGLTIGCDGDPSWAVTDLIITQKGKDYLNPPKEPVSKWLIKPLTIKLIYTAIMLSVGYSFAEREAIYQYLSTKYQQTFQEQKTVD